MVFKFGNISVDGTQVIENGVLNILKDTRQAKIKIVWMDGDEPVDLYLVVTRLSDVNIHLKDLSASYQLTGYNAYNNMQFQIDAGVSLKRMDSYVKVYSGSKLKTITASAKSNVDVNELIDILKLLSKNI